MTADNFLIAFALIVAVLLTLLIYLSEVNGYREAVRRSIAKATANESGVPCMTNPDREHARVAIQEFIHAAKNEVHILCHRLGADIYDDARTIRTLSRAYKKKNDLKIKVYLREKTPFRSAFVDLLEGWGGEIFDNLNAKSELKDLLDKTGDMCCADFRVVREELKEDQRTGRLYFGDSGKNEKARRLFQALERATDNGSKKAA